MDYETLKIIAIIIGIIGGLISVWKFLIQPLWRVVNSILETLKGIQDTITDFFAEIAVFKAIIPRLEKNINEMGIKYEKKIADLQEEVNALNIDVATLKQKTS